MAGHFLQAVLADGVEKASGGSMIKNFRRLLRRVLQIDFDGVPLAGANALAVFAEGEASFVAGGGDVIELVAGERSSVLIDGVEQIINRDPAGFAELQADAFGFVAQNQAKEFARLDDLFV